MADTKGKLKIFLCHASENKPNVRNVYDRLIEAGYEPWLDSEVLLPGMDWDMEIRKALRASDVVIVCLSSISVVKEGYIQKEMKFAQDIQDEKPRGTIFLIPMRLDKCDIPFDLQDIQWGDYTAPDGFEKLTKALNIRAKKLEKSLGSSSSLASSPDSDSNKFSEIQKIVEQIRAEIPSARYFEFGDDPVIINQIDVHIQRVYEAMSGLKDYYASKPMLKESNPYYEAMMNIHTLQGFIVQVRKSEVGSKENTMRLRVLVEELKRSIAGFEIPTIKFAEPKKSTGAETLVNKSSVFISYAWGDEREEIVNQIDDSLQKRGIKIIRDKRDLDYKGSIKDFMERIGKGDCVIVVISDKYLRSPNCMFELVEIAENKEFENRVFPIVWHDANIYDPIKLIEYIKHWELKRAELAKAIKKLDPANLQGIREQMDLYDRIRDKISGLASILKDMNTLAPEIHRDSDFSHLYKAIEKRINETSA